MEPHIRPARSADAAALARLHAASFEDRWSAADLADLIATPGSIALLAEDGSEPLAFVLARVAGGEAEILTLAVGPEARRRGLGRTLVGAAAAAAAEQGANSLFLEVAVDNQAALALYGGFGFAERGRRKGYYARVDAPPCDALVLCAELPLPH